VRIEIVQNQKQGIEAAKDLLYKNVDSKTALFLSGGTTPKPLYENLAREKKLQAGSVALVDERYGLSSHKNSNEKMIKDAGLIDYLMSQKILFYPILRLHPRGAKPILVANTTEYDKTIRGLFAKFQKRIAIMGIGEDGHIAGLPTRNKKSKIKNQKYVTEIGDFPGEFRERITLTFRALSEMDLLIVLVFGSAKQNALRLTFTQGSMEEIPARFFNLPDISKKTIVITDQKI